MPSGRKTILIVVFVLLLVVVSGIGYLLYHRHQQKLASERAFEADKAHFAQIEKDVQDIKANLEPKLQAGDTATIRKSCGYTAAKFEKGTLLCGVYLRVSYADKSSDKIGDIVDAAIATGRFSVKSEKPSTRNDYMGNAKSWQSIYKSQGDFCNIDQIDFGLAEYNVSCSAVVLRPLYTVTE